MTQRIRSPFEVAGSVWRAIFLREALDRLFEARAAWLWLLGEPILYIAIHAFGFSAMHIRAVGGMSINMWIISGFVGFLLWRRTWVQVLHAVDSNKVFFAYRQVKPLDVGLMRAMVEIFLMVPITLVIYLLAVASGHAITRDVVNPLWVPGDPLLLMLAFLGLWLFGLGVGLITSVGMRFVPELDHIFKMIYQPLYYMSGALLPLSIVIPAQYQYIFVANPVVDGLEMMRQGIFPGYHPLAGSSLAYLYAWALGSLLIGLALYKRFSRKLVTR